MSKGAIKRNVILGLFFVFMLVSSPAGQVLKKGDRVAIAGDYITQSLVYSKFMETYFLVCVPELDIKILQLGCPREQAIGFVARMGNDLMPWKATVLTVCYGMEDGHYRQYTASTGMEYEKAMRKIITTVKESGGIVVIGSPGVVDSTTYRGSSAVYNEALGSLGEIDRRLAAEYKFPFADIHGAMMSAMTNSKAVYGIKYHLAGREGVFPDQNGSLVMAYAFLKALGMDGEIGKITVDFPDKAEATAGHAVLNCASGIVNMASTRYPFCFSGSVKTNQPSSMAGILPFVPFQQDLNRYILVVNGLPGSRAEIRWGKDKKTFSREQLARGINLAAEFLDNPFCKSFFKVMDDVWKKQRYESLAIHSVIGGLRQVDSVLTNDSAYVEAMGVIQKRLLAQQEANMISLKAGIPEVRHKIEIYPCSEQAGTIASAPKTK